MKTALVIFAALLVLVIGVAAVRYPLPPPKVKPGKRPEPRICGLFWGAAKHLNKCGRNEVCRPGSRTCGENKCWLANAPGGRPHRCSTDNLPRCFCKRGTWRNRYGECVRLRRCFKKQFPTNLNRPSC
uniref:Putative tick til 21 n=1 Tax=Amblyomma triste TaxID=251400 RepID=A0A023G3W8_AMBTT